MWSQEIPQGSQTSPPCLSAVPWGHTREPTADHWDPWREEATTRKPLLSSHVLRQPSRAVRRCQDENWDFILQLPNSGFTSGNEKNSCDPGQRACSPLVSDAGFKRWISSVLNQDYFCSHKDQRISQSDTEGPMCLPKTPVLPKRAGSEGRGCQPPQRSACQIKLLLDNFSGEATCSLALLKLGKTIYIHTSQWISANRRFPDHAGVRCRGQRSQSRTTCPSLPRATPHKTIMHLYGHTSALHFQRYWLNTDWDLSSLLGRWELLIPLVLWGVLFYS